jgi:predicted transposase YdaD
MKALIRKVPQAFCRLAGLSGDCESVHLEDVTINLPEHRADQVLILGRERWGWHLEYQIAPDRRRETGWLLKNAALNAQLGIPVVLTVVYLTRGRRRRFPAVHTVGAGGLKNRHPFHTIRLWEHAERIRSGELPELAPLLVLCEDNPGEETLRAERRLILGPDVPSAIRPELLAIALTVGTRYFARDLLYQLFREELQMLKGASIIEYWINEAAAQAAAQSAEEGERKGRTAEARHNLLHLLKRRFGTLPATLERQIEAADLEWCRAVLDRVVDGATLEEIEAA